MNNEPTLGLDQAVLYIRNLNNCPPSYLNDPGRKDFFEIVWLKNEDPLHGISDPAYRIKGDWVYLIPPYRVHQLNKAGKNGELISFKRSLLGEEDKNFLLDLFKIFNVQGEFSCLRLDANSAKELGDIYQIMEKEYLKANNFEMMKAMLKVLLLKLMSVKELEFTGHDVHQKRVYEFLMLLENNFYSVTNIDFYAGKLGISSKRLNQILKEKMDKTGTQIIHDRIILEAKRKMIHSQIAIKEIAFDLGFSDRPYFSRFFKKQTGQTPEEFQKIARSHIKSNFNTLV